MGKRSWQGPVALVVLAAVFVLGAVSAPFVNKGLVRPAEAAARGVYDWEAIADIAETAAPAVVGVTAYLPAQRTGSSSEADEFFHHFFGPAPPGTEDEPRERRGFGTGFVFRADGYILTNAHVIGRATRVEILFQNGPTPLPAKVVGQSSLLDLAVLKVDTAKNLPVLPLGDSGRLRAGQWVVAIGNSLGYDHTVTAGVISATNRRVQAGGLPGQPPHVYEDLLQTDAAINPGNSGGPLLDLDGKVVGINAVVSAVGQGIGFAIPINIAREALDQLIRTGHYSRPWLGVGVVDLAVVGEETRQKYQVPSGGGVFVVKVYQGSPAEGALVEGDAIVALDGKPIRGTNDLTTMVRAHKMGDSVGVSVVHRGKDLEFTVTLAEQPDE